MCFELNSLVLIEAMSLGILDEAADKGPINFDRAMIKDFLSVVSVGNFESWLSVFTERVSDQNWGDLTEKVRVKLMAVIPQIIAEAPLVSAMILIAQISHRYQCRHGSHGTCYADGCSP